MKVFCNAAIYATIFHITYFKYAFEVQLFRSSSNKIGTSEGAWQSQRPLGRPALLVFNCKRKP